MTFIKHYIFQAGKLSEDDRKHFLGPLFQKGWSVQDNRDALYKEFKFKNFNEVSNNISS